jgi:hypothetical protein
MLSKNFLTEHTKNTRIICYAIFLDQNLNYSVFFAGFVRNFGFFACPYKAFIILANSAPNSWPCFNSSLLGPPANS